MTETPGFWEREYAHDLSEHRHPANEATHFVGIPLLIGTAVAALVLRDWRLFVGGQLVGWALQLLGHRIEGNRPVLLQRPSAFLMGPLMLLVELAGLLGWSPAFARRARLSGGAADARPR